LTAQGLSLGKKVEEERQPGETYFNGEFNDWSMRCIFVPDEEDPCQMYQLLSDPNGSPIIEFTMFRLTEESEAVAGATVVVPLETALGAGLTIKVDEEPAKSYPFLFCNRVGCFARIGLTAEEIETYKRGSEAEVSLVPMAAPDRRVTGALSLSGFTAAYEAASVVSE
jgi:invasion protein IalB